MTRQLRYVERADFVVQQSIYTCLTSRMIGDFRSACISVLKQTSGIFHKVTQHVLAKWSIKEPRLPSEICLSGTIAKKKGEFSSLLSAGLLLTNVSYIATGHC